MLAHLNSCLDTWITKAAHGSLKFSSQKENSRFNPNDSSMLSSQPMCFNSQLEMIMTKDPVIQNKYISKCNFIKSI